MDEFRTGIVHIIIQGMSSYEAYQKFPEQVARIQALQDEISGGTTAVLALIFQNKLFVANVGDSRALLCKETPEGHLSVEQVIQRLLCNSEKHFNTWVFFGNVYNTICVSEENQSVAN